MVINNYGRHQKKIEQVAEDGTSPWLKKPKKRRKNSSWQRKSQGVASCVLTRLKEQNIQQKELAEALDVSPQQLNKIVKGRENLTLQTFTKLEQVLCISLFEISRKHALNGVELGKK